MNDPTIKRIADELTSRIQEAPQPAERPTRRQYLADNGYTYWTPDTLDADIVADLEAGGYTREKAGTDFPRVVSAVRALLNGEIDGLIFSGKTGCGKTTAARVIAKRALSEVIRPDDTYYEDDLPIVCKHDAVNCSHGNLGIVTSHYPSGALFLDDLGADRPKKEFGNESDPVADYIVSWADAKKRGRLLVTTNLDAAGIKSRYDDRVLSRLIERCGWLTMEAPDHRLANLRKF